MPSDYVYQNEPAAALRTVTLQIKNSSGGGVTGISLTGGTPAILKIAKQGGNFGSSAGAVLTELTGYTTPGLYDLTFPAADLDTAGDLRFDLSQGTGPAFVAIQGYLPVRPRPADPRRAGTLRLQEPVTRLRVIRVFLFDDVGQPLAANHTFSAGDVKLVQPDGTIANAAHLPTSASNSIFTNLFELQLDQAEVAQAGILSVQLHGTGLQDYQWDQRVDIDVAAGLLLANARIDGGAGQASVIYDSFGLPVNQRIRVFATSAAASAASAGAADDADGEIMRFLITASDAGGGKMGSFAMTRVK